MKTELTRLFAPYRMKNIVVKNRFVRSPMESSLGFPDGMVTNDHLRMYRTAAEGGVGLIIMEGVAVHPISKMTDAQMTAFGDESIPGFTKLAKVMHAHGDGIVVWAQLYCGGAASFGYSYGQDDYGIDLNTFKDSIIEEILDAYASAALILKKSGFDGVEIHGGHGYLVSQFLSPAVNKRTDKWGGTPEKRMTFPLEILRRIRALCGEDFPVGIKMNTADFLPEGNWLTDTAKIARAFAEEGYDFIEASGGMGFMTELREALRSKAGDHEYYFKEAIPAFKRALEGTGAALCVTGGIGDPVRMEEMLADGVDFIGLARPWLTEPDLANRIKAGDLRETRCVSREHICNLCLTRLALGPVTCYKFFPGYCKMECPVDQDAAGYIDKIALERFDEAFYSVLKDNPLPGTLCRVCNHPCESVCRGKTGEPLAIRDLKQFAVAYGKEKGLFQAEDLTLPDGEKVAVIGAGPAGLACGWSLAKRGYRPVIFEKNERPGGALNAIPRFRLPEKDLEDDIQYIRNLGVTIKTGMTAGRDFTLSSLAEDGYKAVFLACGATEAIDLKVAGRALPNIYTGLSYLLGVNQGESFALGERVMVLGGGSVAFDAAMTAAKSGCKEVTIVALERREEMPAEPREIEEALAAGVRLINSRGLASIEGTDAVTSVTLKQCVSVFDETGSFAPRYNETDLSQLTVDAVILAIGQKADLGWLDEVSFEKILPGGKAEADPVTLKTAIPSVFIGGDALTGPKTIADAVQAGKEAAESIDRFIRGVSLARAPKDETYEPFFKGAAAFTDPSEQIKKTVKSLREKPGSQGVFTAEQAVREARRCLKYDLALEAESAARYANMGKAEIDFRHVTGEKYGG